MTQENEKDDRESEWAQEFQAWRSHPVTQVLMRWLQVNREELRSQWEHRQFLADTKHTADTINGHAMGKCELARQILELRADELMERDNEE